MNLFLIKGNLAIGRADPVRRLKRANFMGCRHV